MCVRQGPSGMCAAVQRDYCSIAYRAYHVSQALAETRVVCQDRLGRFIYPLAQLFFFTLLGYASLPNISFKRTSAETYFFALLSA